MTVHSEETAASAPATAGGTRAFNRVLLKLSGEALMGDEAYGLDPTTVEAIARELVEVQAEGLELAGKPEAAKDKIVEGMLAKRFYAAQPGGVLTEQPWIHEASQTVGQALASGGARVVAFRRLSVSE